KRKTARPEAADQNGQAISRHAANRTAGANEENCLHLRSLCVAIMSGPGALGGAQPGEIIHALAQVALESALDGLIKILPADLFGKILLARKGFGRIVIVDIAFAIALPL